MCPVPAVDGDISPLHRRRHLGAVRALRGVALESREGAVRGGRGDGVHGLLGDVHHGLWAAQGAVPAQGALLVVELALLPLVELPHGVIAHGAPLVLGAHGPHGPVVGSHAAQAFWTCLAVPWQCPVPLWVPGQHLGSMAWHVPWQRLVGDDAGTQVSSC